jgi:hypothetical protein
MQVLKPTEEDKRAGYDEADLSLKLKQLAGEVVYLDFLFGREGVDKIAAIVESERCKVDASLKECLTVIVKHLTVCITNLDTDNDRQVNAFSDVLKCPADASSKKTAAQSTVTSSQMLSIKVINKKMIVGRMHKQKADLYMLLNAVNTAVYYYHLAYSLAKKEEDSVWWTSALEGLCAASYLHLLENGRAKANALTSSGEGEFF